MKALAYYMLIDDESAYAVALLTALLAPARQTRTHISSKKE
jgi:hypothetical protein